MKLNYIIAHCSRRQVIRRFGGAQLVRHAGGRHELIGGSDADRQTAMEWASLFAHEVVFMPRQRASVPCRCQVLAANRG
jgi:hypothetical protein